jgi:beta-ureidopropionase / N-carbamoyl-L-amino-acid hydrolase
MIACGKVYPGCTDEQESSFETMTNLHIDAVRLLSRIDALGAIGVTPEGGVRRLALSDEDRAARDQVVAWMRSAGLRVEVDRIGNIFGTRAGTEESAPVMTGSHIDSVANGGKLDGAYGVLAGIEVIETLNDAGVETPRPIVVCAFTNEEGARFQPDMLGSLVHAGGLSLDDALSTADADGVLLGDELARIGYAGDGEIDAIRPHAFVEVHIEQGPILEAEAIRIGAVEDLQGISWTGIDIIGQANHAGTTPMSLRHDAGYCTGAITSYVREITLQLGGQQVGTVGVIDLEPEVINVIPGRAHMTVDLRNTNEEQLKQAEKLLGEFLEKLAASEGVEIKTTRLARFDPVRFDDAIAQLIENNAALLGLSSRRMTSGAGHDAQMMARICPAAMIFVPSVGGVSHNPAEHTHRDDLNAGANVLLHTLLDLATA